MTDIGTLTLEDVKRLKHEWQEDGFASCGKAAISKVLDFAIAQLKARERDVGTSRWRLETYDGPRGWTLQHYDNDSWYDCIMFGHGEKSELHARRMWEVAVIAEHEAVQAERERCAGVAEGDSWESVKALPVSTPFPFNRARVVDVYDGKNDTMRKAADLIIALEAEIERLKADLNDRDDFLCFTNNWDEFTEWIAGDKSRTARRANACPTKP
ncbi:MAG TPA: hypothetical protein VKA19_13090 [Alphaproteobacteria bacterium]|nr:hypothetical protein [Alphaproteobacteria bacterium]